MDTQVHAPNLYIKQNFLRPTAESIVFTVTNTYRIRQNRSYNEGLKKRGRCVIMHIVFDLTKQRVRLMCFGAHNVVLVTTQEPSYFFKRKSLEFMDSDKTSLS